MLNCNTKSVNLQIPERKKLEWEGVYKTKQAKIIFSIQSRKLVGQDFYDNLDHIRDVDVEKPSIVSILVVSEFEKMFPTNFCGMHLDKDINFCIDWELGTHTISIPPYRKAPEELRELKSQI